MSGAGVTVAVIDTGIMQHNNQVQMPEFASDQSSNRHAENLVRRG